MFHNVYVKTITPYVNDVGWQCNERFSSQYKAVDIKTPGPGKLQLVYTPEGGQPEVSPTLISPLQYPFEMLFEGYCFCYRVQIL